MSSSQGALPRAVFMGTPQFAVPCLSALLEVADVQAVICQPDKPKGRRMRLAPPPVKELALERGLDVWQPRKVRDGSLAAKLRELELDVALVVAYGRILPLEVLNAPRLGCVNVHGSLLPRWRGAAPIQWAVIEGDAVTGSCLMQMDEGMDTGPELARCELEILPNETSGELAERLSAASADLVRRELPRFVAGELPPQVQPEQGVTHARMLEKADSVLDFQVSAQALHNRVRGMAPWPGTVTFCQGRRIKLHVSRVHSQDGSLGEPGVVLAADADGVVVACGTGSVRFEELQAEGKRRMPAAAFLSGFTLSAGDVLGPEPTPEEPTEAKA